MNFLAKRAPRLTSWAFAAALACLGTGGCAFLSGAGPSTSRVVSAPTQNPQNIRVVPVDYGVAKRLEQRAAAGAQFSAFFPQSEAATAEPTVGAGDVLQVYLWEAPPAALFTPQALATAGLARGGASAVTLPDQVVNETGVIQVPFVGAVPVKGKTLDAIAAQITQGLHGIANDPQVIVKLGQNNSHNISVLGEVPHATEVPVVPGGVRVLRALAVAGGSTHPVGKTVIQVTRQGRSLSLPLSTVLGDPNQNILLDGGDVLTVLFQPYSFTVMGAAGRNAEVDFEASGINVLQAIARSGGVDDQRANPAGVFVFRFEPPDDTTPGATPANTLVNGKVPTVYQFNLRDPAVFFAAQSFAVKDKDLLYVSNAPSADLEKVLGVVGSIVYPFASLYNMQIIH